MSDQRDYQDRESADYGSVYCKGGTDMKVGKVVRYRGRDYRVGVNRTDTSIELVELKQQSVGLWVSRDEVHAVPQGSEQSIDSVEFTSGRSSWRLNRLLGRLQNR